LYDFAGNHAQKKQFLQLFRGQPLLRHLPEALGTYLAKEAGLVGQRFDPLEYLRDNFASRVRFAALPHSSLSADFRV
jgi:hypothetical protein